MATSTTIVGLETVWWGNDSTTLNSTIATSNAQWTVSLTQGFTLYIPYTTTTTAAVTPSELLTALNSLPENATTTTSHHVRRRATIPVFGGIATPTTIDPTPLTLSPGYTVFIPVTTTSLSTYVDAAALSTGLEAYAASASPLNPMSNPTSPSASSTAGTSTPGVSASSSSSTTTLPVTSGAGTSQTTPSHSSSSSSGTNNATNAASSSPATPTSHHTGSHFSEAAFIGGTVGGFVGGLLLGTLVACLWLRIRRTGRKSEERTPEDLSATEPRPRDATNNEKQPILVGSTDVTGWRKHLPQEKGIDTIARSFETTFDQARMHVEGYYGANAGTLSSEDIARLHQLAPEDLVNTLSQAKDATPVLEAILVRWIVQRVSLRSNTDASLLPLEYTGIPKKSLWHMERDAHERPLTAESKKGFPQAFSQWRALASFLYPEPRSDQQFQQGLNRDIDEAVMLFAQAYSPWSVPGRSQTNRDENLRNILRQASDAGVQLFQQPSTFMFDWREDGGSGQGRTVIVTPALVRRLDEHAELLRPAETLVKARQERISRT